MTNTAIGLATQLTVAGMTSRNTCTSAALVAMTSSDPRTSAALGSDLTYKHDVSNTIRPVHSLPSPQLPGGQTISKTVGSSRMRTDMVMVPQSSLNQTPPAFTFAEAVAAAAQSNIMLQSNMMVQSNTAPEPALRTEAVALEPSAIMTQPNSAPEPPPVIRRDSAPRASMPNASVMSRSSLTSGRKPTATGGSGPVPVTISCPTRHASTFPLASTATSLVTSSCTTLPATLFTVSNTTTPLLGQLRTPLVGPFAAGRMTNTATTSVAPFTNACPTPGRLPAPLLGTFASPLVGQDTHVREHSFIVFTSLC